jgi:hypothetical protein
MNFKQRGAKKTKTQKHNCHTPLVTQAKIPRDTNTQSPSIKTTDDEDLQVLVLEDGPWQYKASGFTIGLYLQAHCPTSFFVGPSFLFMSPQF